MASHLHTHHMRMCCIAAPPLQLVFRITRMESRGHKRMRTFLLMVLFAALVAAE